MSTGNPIRSFRDLVVWQRAKQLTWSSLQIRSLLPRDLRYVVGDQILRSAWSIPSNIAEGRGRLSKPDNVRHLTIARGSLEELESHIDMAVDFELLKVHDAEGAMKLCSEVGRMLNTQIRTLGNRRL
jgi:four helix bundle protein